MPSCAMCWNVWESLQRATPDLDVQVCRNCGRSIQQVIGFLAFHQSAEADGQHTLGETPQPPMPPDGPSLAQDRRTELAKRRADPKAV